MKLVTFTFNADPRAHPRIGALHDDGARVVDLIAGSQAMGRPPQPYLANMLAFLDGGEEAMETARGIVAFVKDAQPLQALPRLETLALKAPVPRPRSLRDCVGFERHAIQCLRAAVRRRAPLVAALDAYLARAMGRGFLRPPKVWYTRPFYYKGNPLSVVGPNTDVRWPSFTKRLDYELEFGVFIGRAGRNIPLEQAKRHIAGYAIFNDFSARDVQWAEAQSRVGFSKSKDFDTGNAIGPVLVTPDDVPDPYRLRMAARVNGEEWSRGTTEGMRYRFEELIAFISKEETLYPGEFIGSGAVGNGCGLELGRWLKPGDVVELEVEHLGVLRNRVVAAAPA